MTLLKSDLCRSLLIGFAAGAILVATVLSPESGSDLAQNLAPPAIAAPAR